MSISRWGNRIGRKPDSWLQPDVSLTHPGQAWDDYYEGAPMVAIEVISDANAAAKVEAKILKYLTHGGREVWVVYPGTRRVLTHYADRDEISAGRESIRSAALPEVASIPLAGIW